MHDVHVRLEGVKKSFGSTMAVKGLDLDIARGSFTTLLGPSGCGKTTTLRMIAGFFDPDEGSILIDGKRQNGIPPFRRNVSIVFQEYALFPHMTVFENVSYGLRVRKLPKAVITERVERVLAMLGLEGLEGRSPGQLSGGQQQRVALARSLVLEPDVLLMDEPMSNLDAKLRVRLRAELRQVQQRLGITTIYVTHDQEEALALSDYVAVMDGGVLQQYSDPWELYFRPRNRFVADFVGLANFLPGTLRPVGDGWELSVGPCTHRYSTAPRGTLAAARGASGQAGGGHRGSAPDGGDTVTVMIRPEWARLRPAEGPQPQDRLVLEGKIETHTFLGAVIRYWVRLDKPDALFIVDAGVGPEAEEPVRGRVRVEVPWTRVHFVPEAAAPAGSAAQPLAG